MAVEAAPFVGRAAAKLWRSTLEAYTVAWNLALSERGPVVERLIARNELDEAATIREMRWMRDCGLSSWSFEAAPQSQGRRIATPPSRRRGSSSSSVHHPMEIHI
jgi:hypothetical protein